MAVIVATGKWYVISERGKSRFGQTNPTHEY